MKKNNISHKQTIAEHIETVESQKIKIIGINEMLERTTTLMSKAIELRDPYTRGHSERVADITQNIYEEMFPENNIDIETVRMAALIHDVGKIAISEFVLNKPTMLTEAEYEMIKTHTKLGKKLLESLELDGLLVEAVLYHHENYDGSGYPYGLQGKEIPIIARVIRVADYFDALTSNRPYRKSLGAAEALNMMIRNRNNFDPKMLDIFINQHDKLISRGKQR